MYTILHKWHQQHLQELVSPHLLNLFLPLFLGIFPSRLQAPLQAPGSPPGGSPPPTSLLTSGPSLPPRLGSPCVSGP